MPTTPFSSDVLVVGAGLSGLSAALCLGDSGRFEKITLLEKRPFLGGRTFSYRDRVTGHEVDNAQHIFIGACSQIRALIQKLGMPEDEVHFQKRFDMPARHLTRGQHHLRTMPGLPVPLNFAPSFLTFGALSFPQRLQLAWGMHKIFWMSEKTRLSLEGKDFGSWLRSNGQSDGVIRLFWSLLVEATLNTAVNDCDAASALFVFREGFFTSSECANMGWFKKGQSVLADRMAEYCEKKGVKIVRGAIADRLHFEKGRITGLATKDGRTFSADQIITAVPPNVLTDLLPPALKTRAPFNQLPKLDMSPILGVHLWYDREVMEGLEYTALLESPAHWVFDKNRNYGVDGPPFLVSALQSASDEATGMTHTELIELFDKEVRKYFPKAKDAKLLHARVVQEVHSTLRCLPGFEALRPEAKTPVPGFYLAGEWTATRWPSTMEGAIRAGEAAAKAVLES